MTGLPIILKSIVLCKTETMIGRSGNAISRQILLRSRPNLVYMFMITTTTCLQSLITIECVFVAGDNKFCHRSKQQLSFAPYCIFLF